MIGRRNQDWLLPDRLALVLLVVQPFVVKLPLLLNWLKSNPLLTMAGFGSATFKGLGGTPTLDPNIAFTSHALGTLAARDIVAGTLPWWNSYEGAGAPLAGEMQSAALFPFTWLMIFPNGQLLEHVLFQVVAGCATYFLLKRIGLGVLAAWFGATAYSFNGTFAWLANAVINPICFLPVILLGIETLRDPDRTARLRGGLCVAAGIALSLYAGFPETAYLNGLFAAGWTAIRIATAERPHIDRGPFMVLVGLFGFAGCLIAAPILVAFADYLRVSYVGLHTGGGVENSLRPYHAAMMFVPYLPGALSRGHVEFWGSIGGFIGITSTVLAIVGYFGGSDRVLCRYLAAYSLIAVLLIYGIEPVATIANLVPGVGISAVYRYIEPSLFLAVGVLAAIGIDKIASDGDRVRLMRKVCGAVLVATLALAVFAYSKGLSPTTRIEWLPILVQVGIALLCCAILSSRNIPARYRPWLVAVSSLAEILLLFVVPLLSYPIDRNPELRGVRYLQRNIGLSRFVSLGDIGLPGSFAANYGSYFGIAQVNWNDLPTPIAWVDYVRRHIEPDADAVIFRTDPDNVIGHLAQYAAIGTRYVTAPLSVHVPGLPKVYSDDILQIYEVPNPKPYFSARGCAITVRDRGEVTARCSQPSKLVRLELMMAGWSATVNGHPVKVASSGEIFQSVDVPTGSSLVRFHFEPPGMTIGYVLCGLGLLFVGLGWWINGRIVRRDPQTVERDPIGDRVRFAT